LACLFPLHFQTPITNESRLVTELQKRIKKLERDSRKLKQTEDELRRLGHQNELILNSAGEGIFGLDRSGNITFANPAASTMLGCTIEELAGKNSHNICHHTRVDGTPYPEEDCPIYAAFMDGEVHIVTDEVFWRKDGSSFPVEYISTPILERDQLVGAVVTFLDITQRKKAETELLLKHKELYEANTALKVLLNQTDNAREELEEKIVFNIKELVFPLLEELESRQSSHNSQDKEYLQLIKSSLNEITSSFSIQLNIKYHGVTPREIQIADFIRRGKTTKEIAALLNISKDTVEFHRRNLRTKLHLKNKNISLRSFLLSQPKW
jgi:PAS domain S-box-containing protein